MNQAEASAHVHFIYDVAASRLTYVNPAYEKVLQGHRAHATEELPALLARLHPEDQAYLAHCWKLWVRGQLSDEVKFRLLAEDQSEQWFCLTPYCERPDAGTALVSGTLRDISVLKRYQQNADSYNTRKNATLEILSHDLSNTFIMVQQISAYLREKMSVQDRAENLLQTLESTSAQSLHMIRELINLEFLASANTDLKRDRVEVGAALAPPLEELQHRQQLLGHRFEYQLPAEPVYAALDVNKMTQGLTNLLSNTPFHLPPTG